MNSLIFQYGSAVVGGLAVLSVCYVFLKAHAFEKSGFGLLVSGVILIGLPVWSSAKFALNSDGLKFEFKTIAQTLASLETKIESSGVVNTEIKTELIQLAKAVQKVQAANNLSLATFASSPYLSNSKSPLANAYSILATGTEPVEVGTLIKNPGKVLTILKNTEALTEKINENIKMQETEKNNPNTYEPISCQQP